MIGFPGDQKGRHRRCLRRSSATEQRRAGERARRAPGDLGRAPGDRGRAPDLGAPRSPSRSVARDHASDDPRRASRALRLGGARSPDPHPLLHSRAELGLQPGVPAPAALGSQSGRRPFLAHEARPMSLAAREQAGASPFTAPAARGACRWAQRAATLAYGSDLAVAPGFLPERPIAECSLTCWRQPRWARYRG